MTRFTIASVMAAAIMSSGNVKAEDKCPEFKIHPIGHIQKDDDRTFIVLDKKHQPGLLGVDGYSHIYMFWWFDKNDTPEKRAVLQVHPMGNRRIHLPASLPLGRQFART